MIANPVAGKKPVGDRVDFIVLVTVDFQLTTRL